MKIVFVYWLATTTVLLLPPLLLLLLMSCVGVVCKAGRGEQEDGVFVYRPARGWRGLSRTNQQHANIRLSRLGFLTRFGFLTVFLLSWYSSAEFVHDLGFSMTWHVLCGVLSLFHSNTAVYVRTSGFSAKFGFLGHTGFWTSFFWHIPNFWFS